MGLDILYGSWDIWAEKFRDFFAICTIQQRCFSAFLKMRKVELLNEIKVNTIFYLLAKLLKFKHVFIKFLLNHVNEVIYVIMCQNINLLTFPVS